MRVFRFKQFSISDENSLMKVGTDSVLLGAWINESPAKILDIGTGSGLLSVMLAHKTNAIIDAIEIDNPSSKQASENTALCKMTDRITVHNLSFNSFLQSSPASYDLIVTNPPYFTDSLKSDDKQKNLWRHNDTLTHESLLHGVSKLLSADGNFYLILPYNEYNAFINKALTESLYLNEQINIVPKEGKPENRVLLKMSKHKSSKRSESTLTIRLSDNSFAQEYKTFTKDYYLEF